MAMIYDIVCSPTTHYSRVGTGELKKEISKSCDFAIRDYWGPNEYIKMDDGSERILPKPSSDDIFEKLTGKTLKQLLKEKRIILKDHKFCIKCFKAETGYNSCECEEPELMDISTLKDGSLCPKCKAGRLREVQKAIS
jgi:hypothetical protein